MGFPALFRRSGRGNDKPCNANANDNVPVTKPVASDYTNSSSNEEASNVTRIFTIYLIRHGEALHNVQEKAAMKVALQSAVDGGYGPNDPETHRRRQQAREAVLQDPAFFDAPLSHHGKRQALQARARLVEMWEQWPRPSSVLVSPLQRTLQICDLLFPPNNDGASSELNIHVRAELRERVTGRPADNRHSALALRSRPSFGRFSFQRLCNMSELNEDMVRDSYHEYEEKKEADNVHLPVIDENKVELSGAPNNDDRDGEIQERRGSSYNSDRCVEDEQMVYERASELLRLLWETSEDVVAVVSHKGFLRGLEVGVLQRPGLYTEFDNCETRVYRLCLNNKLDIVEAKLLKAVKADS